MELTKIQKQIIEPLKNISIEIYNDQVYSMKGFYIEPKEYNLTKSQIKLGRKIRTKLEEYNNSKESAYDMIIEGTNKLKRLMKDEKNQS